MDGRMYIYDNQFANTSPFPFPWALSLSISHSLTARVITQLDGFKVGIPTDALFLWTVEPNEGGGGSTFSREGVEAGE